jgi:hypothetical protein
MQTINIRGCIFKPEGEHCSGVGRSFPVVRAAERRKDRYANRRDS